MNLNPLLAPLLDALPMLAILAGFGLLIRFLKSPRFKGAAGEKCVQRALSRLDSSGYRSFHDLYLPRPDGKGTTQIDHVVVSPFGIFVIETKNYQGWIYGTKKQRQWTQVVHKRKSRFQNPLWQNRLHVEALAGFLGLSTEKLFPAVLFVGDAKLKTSLPSNVLTGGIVNWIQTHREPQLLPPEQEMAMERLTVLDQKLDRRKEERMHLAKLSEIHG